MSVICEICNSKVSNKYNLVKHKQTESCQKIKRELDYNKNINSLNNQIKELENEIIKLKKNNNEKDLIIYNLQEKSNNLQEKSEEYRKIIENVSLNNKKNNFTLNKIIQDNQDNTFQIDINVNNKQLNKTKFKDVPEEQVKNIQSLKIKDNYQLEYREIDGFINITNLCKAGGKEFKSWNRLDKTKKFLEVLSSSVKIHTDEIIKYESGSIHERSTWAHPQVAINIAQWISPEFDVLVSKWVYEIMLTSGSSLAW